jgi:hypothetical protein
MQIPQIAGPRDPRIPAAEIHRVLTKRLMCVLVVCLVGTAAAMGSGSGGGSAASNPLQQEVGGSAFKALVAVFDRLITKTARQGFYIVYLFRGDLNGVYLSLNQGVTSIREV